MNPTQDQNTVVVKTDCQNLVKAARELARHALRTRNVRAQMDVISNLKLQKVEMIEQVEAQLKSAKGTLEANVYQQKKLALDETLGKPNFAKEMEQATKKIADAEANVAEIEKILGTYKEEKADRVVAINEEIKKAEEKISRWELGENKVQLENLNKLTSEYIEKALNEKARKLADLVA